VTSERTRQLGKLGLWLIGTVGIVSAYDRFLGSSAKSGVEDVSQPRARTMVRPLREEGSASRRATPPDSFQAAEENVPPSASAEPGARVEADEPSPEEREVERRQRFAKVTEDFQSRSRVAEDETLADDLEHVIAMGMESVDPTIDRGKVECRGGECSMPVSFPSESVRRPFDDALRTATAAHARASDAAGLRVPLLSVLTYQEHGRSVGRYFVRWKQFEPSEPTE